MEGCAIKGSQNCVTGTVWQYVIVGVHCSDEARTGSVPVPSWVSCQELGCEEPGLWGQWWGGQGGSPAALGGRLGDPKTVCGQRGPGLGRLVLPRPLLLVCTKMASSASPVNVTHALPGRPHRVHAPPGSSALSLQHTFLLRRAGGNSVRFSPSPLLPNVSIVMKCRCRCGNIIRVCHCGPGLA